MFLIKPAKEDLKVMNPSTMGRLPEQGIVEQRVTTYWKRRKKDGDVTIEDMSKKPQKKASTKNENGGK